MKQVMLFLFLFTQIPITFASYSGEDTEEFGTIIWMPTNISNEWMKDPASSKLHGLVEEVFSIDNRFNLLDRQKMTQIILEQDSIQADWRFLESSQIKTKWENAEYGVSIIITRFQVNGSSIGSWIKGGEGNQKKNNDKKTIEDAIPDLFKAEIDVTLSVVDFATGKKKTKSYSEAATAMNQGMNAIIKAIRQLENEIQSFKTEFFPVTAEFFDVDEIKKGKLKTFLMAAGEAQGIRSGARYIVQKIERRNGKEFPRSLGIAEVMEVMGEETSLMKVKKGHGEILNAINAGEKIILKESLKN